MRGGAAAAVGLRLPLMGLSVPEVMADLEDHVSKGVLVEESGAPESWEMVDLEENMKKLLGSSQVDASSQVLVEPCIANESSEDGVNTGFLPPRTDDDSLDPARGPDQVDGFLKEALQNPRDRLTSNVSILLLFETICVFMHAMGYVLLFLFFLPYRSMLESH